MDYHGAINQSLPLEEIIDIGVHLSSGDGPFPLSDVEEKEREVIHSNRVKLTDYIHDPTVLFPYMKESDVFSVYDCEIIKGESVPHNKVDKFIDVLLTKGPKAIGVFHEALGKTYPGLFDYFTRLFTSRGVDLPEARRMRPASQADHSEMLGYDEAPTVNSRFSTNDIQDDIPWKNQMKVLSRRGMTVRRSLDLLSKQLETIQTERNELKNTLSEKEKEISDLLKSKEKNHDDLLSITQHYQDLSKELLQLRESLSTGGSHKIEIEKMAAERESIRAEYDALENDYTLVQLELRAARERISKLMGHLERSESLVAFAQEERDAIQHKLSQLEGQLQRKERKQIRIRTEGSGGRSEVDALYKQIDKYQKELEQSRNESVELSERLKVARHERSQAYDEKDEIVRKLYLEEQARKKADNELKQLRKQLKDHDSHSSDGSFISYPLSTPSEMAIEMDDFTTVMQVSDNMGMKLGLGVIVTDVSDGGLAGKSGLRNGDQLFEVNHFNVTLDRDPLELCNRLLHSASNLVTLLIRRPVIVSKSSGIPGQSQTMPSQIKQMPVLNDGYIKSATIDRERFQLSLSNTGVWNENGSQAANSTASYGTSVFSSSTPTSGFVTSPSFGAGRVAPSLGFHTLSTSNPSVTTESTNRSTKDVVIRRRHRQRRISSDDGHNSSRTSSSDDGSSDQSGLLHSPTHNCVTIFDSDSDVPFSVTRPPTIVADEDFGDSFYLQNSGTKDLRLDLYNSNSIKPSYKPMSSSPASFSPEPQMDTSAALRRKRAIKWQNGQRRSQSLVDMPDNLFERAEETTVLKKDEIEMLQMRRIVLPWGKLGDGIKIVGGRGRGIFFYTKKNDSRGLQSGDQLVKIGPAVVTGATYSDAVLSIDEYCQKGEQCMITVHSNTEAFSKIPSIDSRDDFYVRALFYYKQQISPGELLFSKGDVFHVVDTLPDGKKDFWKVQRLNMMGEVEEEGNIPLVHKLTAWMASVPSGTSTSLPGIFRLKFPGKRLGSTVGKESYDIDIGRTVFDLYQPVRRVRLYFPRPVVVLGVGDSEVTKALLNDPIFSLPPICTSGSLVMIEDQCSAGNIILKRTGENIRYCKVSDALSIAQEEQHCLLPIEPSQLKNTALIKLHPIVIFLCTQKPNHLSRVKVFKSNPELIQKYLTEMKNLETDYSNHFTCKIEFSGQLENVVKQVKTEINTQEKAALWEEDSFM